MQNLPTLGFALALSGLLGCTGEPVSTADSGMAPEIGSSSEDASPAPKPQTGWSAGDTIPSGMEDVPDIQILAVHKNGSGEVCGTGRKATLKYVAMLADGSVLDPGTRPFSFKVGVNEAIKGWDVVVAKMRVGDSFTITIPQQLAYGAERGDLKFDMELLSVR